MIETNFNPFPTLTTDRLVLRKLEMTDDGDIFSQRTDDSVNKYLENWRHTAIEQTQAWIAQVQKLIADNESILWALSEKGSSKLIGTACLYNISKSDVKAEAGYILSPEYQGRGYMNEALSKVIDFGFNKMKLKTIEACTHPENKGSIQLLLKNQFVLDKSRENEGEAHNRVIFILTNNL